MKHTAINSGLRRHRPRKKFRFEYLKGKFTGMTKKDREIRIFSELEREDDGIRWMEKVLRNYWQDKKRVR